MGDSGALERPTPDRLPVLDGLRFLAALTVVVFHYVASGGGRDAPAWGRPVESIFPHAQGPAAFGWLGAHLFFVISGFVICMTCWGRGPGTFFASRAARLYPGYWFAVLATAGVLAAWPQVRPRPATADVLTNLTMVQAALGVDDVDEVYWTLWVELRFYLLFALVVWAGLTHRRVVVFASAWTVAAALAPAVDSRVVDLVVMPSYAPYFIAGVAMYLVHRFGSSPLLWGIVGFNWLLAQHHLATAIRHKEGWMRQDIPDWIVSLITAGGFAAIALVALGCTDRLRWPRVGAVLTGLGATTYPLYLLHKNIGLVVIYHLRDAVPPGLLVAGLIVAMTSVAYLVHRLVERPIGAWLRRGLMAVPAVVGASRPDVDIVRAHTLPRERDPGRGDPAEERRRLTATL
jgi:peptidoglycan/LPS O-acetylase OafA/YrhL